MPTGTPPGKTCLCEVEVNNGKGWTMNRAKNNSPMRRCWTLLSRLECSSTSLGASRPGTGRTGHPLEYVGTPARLSPRHHLPGGGRPFVGNTAAAARDFRLAADTTSILRAAHRPLTEIPIDSPQWPPNHPGAFPPTSGPMCRHSTASARQAWAPACGSS